MKSLTTDTLPKSSSATVNNLRPRSLAARVFHRIPFHKVNWSTSSFLIGTAGLTLTGLPLYLWFFGAGLVSSCSILRDAERYRI